MSPLQRTTSLRLALTLSLALIPAACGGGGGGGGGGGPANVVFPVDGAATSADFTTVRGTTTGITDVSAVMVNGTSASTSDFFANWTADVQLQPGENSFRVDIVRQNGSVITRTGLGSVRKVESLTSRTEGFAVHPSGQIVAFGDLDTGTVVEVDLQTGAQTLITPSTVTTTPLGLCYDETGAMLYISDTSLDAVLEVDRASGFIRTVTSNSTNSSNPSLANSTDLVYDGINDRLLLSDFTRDAIISVRISSGNRSYISRSGTRGSGPAITSPRGCDLSSSNTILVADRGSNQSFGLYQVQISNGNRSLISGPNRGSGPEMGAPSDVLTSTNGQTAYVVALAERSILEVNLLSGNRTLVSGPGRGTGPELSFAIERIELDPANGRLLVTDVEQDALIEVDPVNGNREIRYRTEIGSGPGITRPDAIAVDGSSNRLFVSDTGSSRIFEVSMSTGVRSVFAGEGVESGSPFEFPRELAVDSTRNRLVVIYGEGDLYALPLSGGEPAALSLNDGSSGEAFDAPFSNMQISPDGQTLFLTDRGELFAVDLVTGMRTRRSATNSFSFASALGIDFDRNLAYVLDQADNAVCSLNLLAPGFPTPVAVSNNSNGSGASISFGVGLAVQPGGEALWLANGNSSAVLSIDLATNTRTLVSGVASGSDPRGTGQQLRSVSAMVVAADGTLLLPDSSLSAVHRVEPVSGARVILTH